LLYYHRRTLGGGDGAGLSVVYAVLPTSGERPDPVPVVAGFPTGWRPTDHPGQCLRDPSADALYYLTTVPLRLFRKYETMSEADALALYPELPRSGA
jgi:hypothetical protein